MVQIGDVVQDFSFEVFQNDEIRTVKFSDFQGKWLVVALYPADFTFVCPTELEELANLYLEFAKLNAEVISVSTDTVYSHKTWHDVSPAIKKIKYPMAADPTGKLCKFFGTYIDVEGLSNRATFIINPEGVIKSYEVHDNSIGRSGKEILRKLKAAIFVKQNTGKVCPASWEPGEETLTPGVKLIGKI